MSESITIEQELIQKGYKNLDFMNTWEITGKTPHEFHICLIQKHPINEIHYSQSKNLCICNTCRIYYYYDCSD